MKSREQKRRGRTTSERVPSRTSLTPVIVEWKPDVSLEARDETPPIRQETTVLSPAVEDREAIGWTYRTSRCVLVVAKLLHAVREHKADLVDLLDEIGERAAVMEYDGGLPRAEAERRAVADLLPHRAPTAS